MSLWVLISYKKKERHKHKDEGRKISKKCSLWDWTAFLLSHEIEINFYMILCLAYFRRDTPLVLSYSHTHENSIKILRCIKWNDLITLWILVPHFFSLAYFIHSILHLHFASSFNIHIMKLNIYKMI